MRSSIPVRLALCLLTLAAIVLPEVASACYGKCMMVAPMCRRCGDSPTYTGVLCQDSGNCGCFYIQCVSAQPEAKQPPTQTALNELGLGAPMVAPASCLSASAEVTPPLAVPAD
jgi:hypothetical protein